MNKGILLSTIITAASALSMSAEGTTSLINAEYYGFEVGLSAKSTLNDVKSDGGWWNPTIAALNEYGNCWAFSQRVEDAITPATGSSCLKLTYTDATKTDITIQASANGTGAGKAPFSLSDGQYQFAIKVYIPSTTTNPLNTLMVTLNSGVNHEYNSFVFPIKDVTERDKWVQITTSQYSLPNTTDKLDFIVADNNFGFTQAQAEETDAKGGLKNKGYVAGQAKLNIKYAALAGSPVTFYVDDLEILPYKPASAEVAEANNVKVAAQGTTLTVTGAEGEQMNVYDIAGRTVLSTKAESDDATYTLTPGLYIVKAGTTTQKVVIK